MSRLFVLVVFVALFCGCDSANNEKVSGLNKTLPEGYEEGKKLFATRCAVCHGKKGEPSIKLYPPLKNSDYLMNNREKIPCVIRYGLEGGIVVNKKDYDMKMASNPDLSAEQISQLINFINNSWGNSYGVITTKEVISILENCNQE